MNLNELRLTDRFRAFIASEVASGRYADESEVVNAALRLLEKQTRDEEEKLARLEALGDEAIAEIEAGRCVVLESDEELREYVSCSGRRATSSLSAEERRARLIALADEGIADLDAGRYDVVESGDELRAYIGRIGRQVSEACEAAESTEGS